MQGSVDSGTRTDARLCACVAGQYYRQVIVSYGRQKDIIYGVRSQQKDVEKRR